MWYKVYILIGSIAFILFGFFYFSTNSSYALANEAKSLYEIGKYDEAIELANLAYEKDNYNRMAFTVITQSHESKRWIKFFDESEKFLNRTKDISNQKVVTKADRYEIKLMAELVLEEYLKLGKRNPMISDEFKEKAKYYHNQFQKLHHELSK
ncbi:MAG: hypothetical protein OIF32_03430 [Campylobacterales bacterium]|nr:hypothetical protein [Campylobacterales bacterium]